MRCSCAPPLPLSGRLCGRGWSRRWGCRLLMQRGRCLLTGSWRPCWGMPSGATVPRRWMASSSSIWVCRCGGGGRWCRRRWLRVRRLVTRLILRARRAASAVVRPLCCCAIAVTGGTTCAASFRLWLVCLTAAGSARAALMHRRLHLARLPLLAAASPVPLMMTWLARCVLAGAARPRCCCVMAVTGASTCGALACASNARPLVTGTARVALAPPLAPQLPPLATLAAARGPMALALRPVYEYYYGCWDLAATSPGYVQAISMWCSLSTPLPQRWQTRSW
jgi:hypothetical protein